MTSDITFLFLETELLAPPQTKQQMIYIYVLALRSGRYYVGKTANLEKRLREHSEGRGSAWTRKYKPVKLIERIQTSDPLAEVSLEKLTN